MNLLPKVGAWAWLVVASIILLPLAALLMAGVLFAAMTAWAIFTAFPYEPEEETVTKKGPPEEGVQVGVGDGPKPFSGPLRATARPPIEQEPE